MADADLDEVETTTEDDEPDHASNPEPAPQCAGCHRRGIGLTLLENGKRYCDRCAHEVERLMGIGPLFASADGNASDDSAEADVAIDALASIEDLLDQTAEAELASVTAAGDDGESHEPSSEGPIIEDTLTQVAAGTPSPTGPESRADATADEPLEFPVEASDKDESEVLKTASSRVAEFDSTVRPDQSAPAADTTELPGTSDSPPPPVADEAAEESIEEAAEETTDDLAEPTPDLTMVVAGANHEAAESANSLIPRPKMTSVNTAEEPPLMERVQEQTRPTRVEATAPAAPPPADLLGALSAERARLLDQRELLEARFRSETGALDERLLHVESLLGDQDKPSESLAS